jgi:hypothetical protein
MFADALGPENTLATPNPAHRLGAPPVAGGRLHFEQCVQPLAERCGRRRLGAVEYPPGVLGVATAFDEPGAAQDGQVVGDQALREVQDVLDLANAQLCFGHEGEDPEAGLVSQGAEERAQVLG